MKSWCLTLCLVISALATPLLARAQDSGSASGSEASPTAPVQAAGDPLATEEVAIDDSRVRVYLDCMRCDLNFIRTEVNFVDYVRDRQGADVHLLITTQQTGAGGTAYTLQFNGLSRFDGVTDELLYTSTVTDSQDEVRRGMARVMSAGLVRYAARTSMAQQMRVSFANPAAQAGRPAAGTAAVRDPWNNWVFRTNLGGSAQNEASSNSLNINASASANRTTAGWKTTLTMSTRVNNNETKVRDTWVENNQRDHTANLLIVKSISDHWSVGGRSTSSHSTFQNRDLSMRLAPAIEFNIYPYSESTRRQLTFQYSAGFNNVSYLQETIYDKTQQTLTDESFAVSFNTRQTWGSGDMGIEANHYFHDLSKYRLQADGSVDFRIYGGLSLNLSASAQRIHDQLYLVKGTLTTEQILLRQTQIATNYRYSYSVGIGYSFGSIFSGAVNPRMGATGGQGGLTGGVGGGGGGGRN